MLAIWYLVPLPFLNPACTSGSSQFQYCWSLAWKILSITLLACEMSTIALISTAGKVMLKILQARLQQYMNREIPDVQAGFRKGRGSRDQIANIRWIIEEAKQFQKNMYFCFIDNAKAFDSVDHNKLWKILRDGNTRPPYLPPEKSVCRSRSIDRTSHRTMDLFKIWKGVRQDCILSPCLFNFYAEYIMQNAWLGKAQAGIKISRKNINNLRNADDTTLWQKAKRD